jgi:outer membrane biosynthesis protein TonB
MIHARPAVAAEKLATQGREIHMQIPSFVLKKMAIGAGTVALTAGAVYAANYPGSSQPGDVRVAQTSYEPAPESTPVPTPTPTATPEPSPKPQPAPRYRDPCPGCGMG